MKTTQLIFLNPKKLKLQFGQSIYIYLTKQSTIQSLIILSDHPEMIAFEISDFLFIFWEVFILIFPFTFVESDDFFFKEKTHLQNNEFMG